MLFCDTVLVLCAVTMEWVVGTPTCHSISSYSIPFHLTALLPLSVHQSTHTDLVNGSLTTTANHSLTPSFSVYFHEQRKRPPASVLHPTSQAYQLCQPANGRADWTAHDRNKRRLFEPMRFIHSERHNWQHTSRKHSSRKPDARLPGHVASRTGHTTAHPGHPAAAHQHQLQLPQFHRGHPANQLRDQRFIIARGLLEASSRHGNAALLHSYHRSTTDDKITASKPRPHLSDCTTTFDINKYLYICVVL